jgi:uncharacterized protein (DUF362 family)/Pyruvate/2-oxoacid:ferredoxin oxidoreductase delta subunit
MEKVCIINCNSYDKKKISAELRKSLQQINFNPKNKKILIKPNLLAPHSPKQAITTNPVIIEEFCKLMKENNCELIIGDSSSHDTHKALKKCGIKKLAKYAKIVNFDKEDKIKINVNGNILKQITLPKILKQVDLIVSLAKMKTHSLTKMTCGVKNLYGCIPGRIKESLHSFAPGESKFSHLLLDIYQEIQPSLCIIDGIEAIEGDGPGATGKKKNAGVIIVSKNCIASDIVASKIMGFKENEILTNRYANERKIFNSEIKIIGKLENLNFKKPSSSLVGNLIALAPFLGKPKLIFNKQKCIKCGLCAKKCPVGAIILKPYPIWQKDKCIRCLCCIEVCPKAAISEKDPFLRDLAKKIFFKIKKID